MIKYAIGIYLLFVWYIIHTFHPPTPDADLSARISVIEDSVKNVNDGGCGFMAYYIYQYLTKKGETCEIRQYGISDRPRIHIMVYYRNTLIDGYGVYGTTHIIGLLPYVTVNPDNLREAINQPGLWNNDFNRADTIKLKSILNL